MEISIGCDHAGFELKERVKQLLEEFAHIVSDLGPFNSNSADYPDFAGQVAEAVSQGKVDRGILICGTGIGMSIAANKFTGVRAALCHDLETARMSRQHNDANILVLPGRFIDIQEAIKCVDKFLETDFESGRHKKRIEKI